jgi:hypothetical protein
MANPTQPEHEKAQGRIAFWLSPEQIAFIADEWRKIPENADPQVKENWAAIAFRAMSALHRAGIAYEPAFPDDRQRYRLTG